MDKIDLVKNLYDSLIYKFGLFEETCEKNSEIFNLGNKVIMKSKQSYNELCLILSKIKTVSDNKNYLKNNYVKARRLMVFTLLFASCLEVMSFAIWSTWPLIVISCFVSFIVFGIFKDYQKSKSDYLKTLNEYGDVMADLENKFNMKYNEVDQWIYVLERINNISSSSKEYDNNLQELALVKKLVKKL